MSFTNLFFLGGMREIGKTTICVETQNDIVIIDAGIKFAKSAFENSIDGIIPNYEYLKKNENKIKGLFITHGHEDHIGGVPYLLKQIHIPKIYAPKLAVEYIKERLKEKKVDLLKTEIIEMNKDLIIEHFETKVDFWTSQHSIPDSFGIRVRTHDATIFDTGDFRFDYTPIGNLTDFSKLERWSDEGIDVLISDSTNAMRQDHSPSETDILKDIEKIIVSATKKVIFTTFASNLNRIQAVLGLAVKHNKKICALGRSMIRGIKVARRLKYIDLPDSSFVDRKKLSKYPDEEVMIFSTGSQGEENSSLWKMSNSEHNNIQLKGKDVIIFSSSAIPGNRMRIELLINQLSKLGVYISENGVNGYLHTSGHAYKKEHVKIFNITKPKYFVPYHGAYRQAAVHGHTAVESGIAKKNVFVLKNGDVLHFENNNVEWLKDKINAEPIYIDSGRIAKDNKKLILERQKMGLNGFVQVIILINSKNKTIIGRTKIITKGTIYIRESESFFSELQRKIHGETLYYIKKDSNFVIEDLKKKITQKISSYFWNLKRREPKVFVTIIDKFILKITNSK